MPSFFFKPKNWVLLDPVCCSCAKQCLRFFEPCLSLSWASTCMASSHCQRVLCRFFLRFWPWCVGETDETDRWRSCHFKRCIWEPRHQVESEWLRPEAQRSSTSSYSSTSCTNSASSTNSEWETQLWRCLCGRHCVQVLPEIYCALLHTSSHTCTQPNTER